MKRLSVLSVVPMCLLAVALLSGCGRKEEEPKAAAPPAGKAPAWETEVTPAGPNLVTNGDFQKIDSEDMTLPAGWRRLQGTSSTIRIVSHEGGREGDLALEIRPHPDQPWWQTLGCDIPLPKGNQRYVVRYEGRTIGEGFGRATLVLLQSPKEVVGVQAKKFTGPEWQEYSFVAEFPEGKGDLLRMSLGLHDKANRRCVVQYDNVSVHQVE